MQPNISAKNAFFKSSFFSTLIYCNFFISACFVFILAGEGVQNAVPKKSETVQQKPLQQSVSGVSVTLISMQ